MRIVVAGLIAVAAGGCAPLLGVVQAAGGGEGAGPPSRGTVSGGLELRSDPDGRSPDGVGMRMTVDEVTPARRRARGFYARAETAFGYARDGGLYVSDGFQLGVAFADDRSFAGLGLGLGWGGYRMTSLQATAGAHALLLNLVALDAEAGVRVPREDETGSSSGFVLGAGARLYVPLGPERPAFSARLVREDGHTYALVSFAVEHFFDHRR